MKKNNLFNKSLFEKCIIQQPYYAIGVDTYDKNIFAYCLIRKINNIIEVLLTKTMNNRKEFEKEVQNLSNYFKADIFR